MANKHTKFNHLWLNDQSYKDWLLIDETNNINFKCKLCTTTNQSSNMGKRALAVHCKSKKHNERVKQSNSASSVALSSWLHPTQSASSKSSSSESTSAEPTSSSSTSSSSEKHATDTIHSNSVPNQMELNMNASRTEILWIINAVSKHQSYNSMKHSSALFSVMFPDSEIAKKFTCNPTKASYLSVFGLAPYFENNLVHQLEKVPFYSVSFDESFNKITKNEQMDFSARFWDNEKQQIVDRYFGSQFLGHATAADLLTHFKQGTSKLEQ